MAETNPANPKPLSDPGEASTPEDVATLYSWANLHGAKYRDFSASRAQAREEARLRVEEALAEQRRREEEEAELRAQEKAQIAARLAADAAEAARQAEEERLAEIARQAEAERQAVLAAQEAQREAAKQRAWLPSALESNPVEFPSPFETGNASPDFHPFDNSADPIYSQSSAYPSTLSTPRPIPDHAPERVQAPAVAAPSVQAAEQDYRPNLVPPQPLTKPHGTMYTTPATAFQEFAPEPLREPYQPLYSAAQQEPNLPSPWFSGDMRDVRDSREFAVGPAWLAPEPQARSATSQPAAQNSYAAPPPPRQPQASSFGQAQPQHSAQFANRGRVPAQPAYASQPQPMAQNPNQPSQQPPAVADDTLLGSRDRIVNRWYALKGVFDPQIPPAEQVLAQPPARVPMLAVFSLAGGVGKTSLVASLGRALSSRGERVLLVDTAAYGLLPFFFGARDQRPGQLRTFNPPGVSADAPIQLVTLDPESHPQDHPPNQANLQSDRQSLAPDWLAQEVSRYASSANRVLIDLPTASGATTRRVLRLAPIVLVPVLPDMNSVVSVGAIEGFFRNQANHPNFAGGKPNLPFYLLNQFDYSLPLHLDVREILREQIGDRLIPFALRRSASVSEALAEGMTVMDYAPNAVVAEDYANLAGWVRSVSAPAAQGYRGVRWSER
jgi:cellulose synthase operon protein YhjQ